MDANTHGVGPVLAAVTCSVLMGLKIAADQHGYITLFGAITASVGLTKPVSAASSSTAAFFTGVMYTIAVLILCAGIMAWARWTRSSDSNALVLQAREEALVAEQEKQRILAANMERDRISASIQAEVTATLNSVISQAVDGIRMLDRCRSTRQRAYRRRDFRSVQSHRRTGARRA